MHSLTIVATLLLVCPADGEAKKEIPRTGTKVEALAPIDSMMESFLEKNELPGASIAISKNGKLVYSAGFGWAERPDAASGSAGKPVQTDTLFRIASISKPITAVAILKLAEQGKLQLSDKVLDHLKIEPYPKATLDPRWKEITIELLLQHRAGFDRDHSFDPMFRSIDFAKKAGTAAPASLEVIIRTMLGRPLDFNPGEKYAYSNFGYCLLGRVIEKCSGRDYETYVRQDVLAPMGITDMVIGKSKRDQRVPKEAIYYDLEKRNAKSVFPPHEQVARPYGSWYHEALDAHGGWLGTAEDLVKFADHLNKAHPQCLLSSRSLDLMAAKPAEPKTAKEKREKQERKEADKKTWYGLGWQFREVGESDSGKLNSWHTGLVPGSSSILVRRNDGFHWAVLFNSHGPDFKNTPASKIDPLVHKAVSAVKQWPAQ